MEPITIQTTINAPIEKIWKYWNEPEHIINWAHASDDWHTVSASNDLKVGGLLKSRMEAKDGSAGFDLESTYSEVEEYKKLAYAFTDNRKIIVTFNQTDNGVEITQTFDPEHENPREMQEQGWQAILNNFKTYVLEH